MYKRWTGIILPFLFILFMAAWVPERVKERSTQKPHTGHDLFALRLNNSEKKEEEIECWKSPYEDNFYLFLPAYGQEENGYFCLNQGERLLINGKDAGGEVWNFTESRQDYSFELYRNGEAPLSGKLTVLCSSKLAALFIDTESGNMEAIHENKEYREGGSYSLVSANGRERVSGNLLYIKGRGNSTWEWGKKPYRIKLDGKKDFLGMGMGESWELLTNYFDGSYLRNKIMYELADEIGLAYSPDSRFIDLYLNGYYAGLYQLAEKIEIGTGRVDIYDLGKENKQNNPSQKEEAAYEAADEKAARWDVEPRDVTGGYLMEWDIDGRYGEAKSGFVTEQGQAVMIKGPSAASVKEVKYIHGLVQEFEDALYAEDGKNRNTGKYFYEYIDLESWAKKYLIEEVSKNFDGGISSQYFYKDRDRQGNALFYAGPVWDYDGSLGNGDWSVRKPEGMLICYDIRIYDPEKGEDVFRNRWFPQLYRHEVFLEEVVSQYQEQMLPAVMGMLTHRVDEYKAEIEVSAGMDQCRWRGEPTSPQKVYKETLEEQVEYVKNFLGERVLFLNTVWIDKVDYCTVCFHTEYGTRNIYFSVERNKFLEKAPAYEESFGGMVFEGWYYDEGYTQPFDIGNAIAEDTDVYAKWVPE